MKKEKGEKKVTVIKKIFDLPVAKDASKEIACGSSGKEPVQ